MTQDERRVYLIERLKAERSDCETVSIPQDLAGQWRLLRSLMNLRPPRPIDRRFLEVQDAFLRQMIFEKGITDAAALPEIQKGISLWRGDITTLRCDAVVNAANSQMLGCFQPCHGCIDNAIHTFAGVQLRLECADLMRRQGHEEPTGSAVLTSAYALPCKFVLHTVGPIVDGRPTAQQKKQLADCYRACLELAKAKGLESVAFCCISTGVFRFPVDTAAQIAVETVRTYLDRTADPIKIIFDVFKEEDYAVYLRLLG